MMGFVPLRSIMEKIVRDHSTAQFSDFKFVILAMLDTYHFETNIFETAKHLFERDHFEAHKAMRQKLVKGFRGSRCTSCILCKKPFGGGKEIMMFDCGHAYHTLCVPEGIPGCPSCENILDQIELPEDTEQNSSISNEDRYQIYLDRANNFTRATAKGY